MGTAIIVFIIGFILKTVVFFFIKYRLPKGKPVTIESEVIFPVIKLNFNIMDRCRETILEKISGNQKIITTTKEKGQQYFYVSKREYNKFSNNLNLSELRAQSKSFILTLEAKPLLFGGFSPAKIKGIEWLNKAPHTPK